MRKRAQFSLINFNYNINDYSSLSVHNRKTNKMYYHKNMNMNRTNFENFNSSSRATWKTKGYLHKDNDDSLKGRKIFVLINYISISLHLV